VDIIVETAIMKKTEKLMSPGILPPVLHSSWQLQWCGGKEWRRGPQNSLQPVQPTAFTDSIVTQEPEVSIAMCMEASLVQAGQGLHVFPSGGDSML